MKEEPTYHIDTTPEEDALFKEYSEDTSQPKPMKQGTFAKIFWAVFGIHILGAGLISLFSSSASANSTIEPKKATEQPPTVQSFPTPTPAPTPASTPVPTPNIPASQPPIKSVVTKQNKPGAAKSYVVKQGDTLYSIAKKYKLSAKRLLQINNIENANKIKVGQVLKFI